MTEKEQAEHFSEELKNLIYRYSNEYEMMYVTMIGCLTHTANCLSLEATGTLFLDEDEIELGDLEDFLEEDEGEEWKTQ